MFMKKKFINGLLMVSMLVGATSSLVSCKDYDDEKTFDLQEQFTAKDKELEGLIDALRSTLNGRIDSLNNEFNDCRRKCAQTRVDLDTLINRYNRFTQWVYDNIYTKDQVYTKGEIDDLFTTKLSDYYTTGEVDEKLKDYYTTAEIDDKLGDYLTEEQIKKLIEAAKNDMSTEISAKLDTLKNYVTIETLSNYYDKDAIDELLAKIEPVVNYYITNDTTIQQFITYGDTTIVNNFYTNDTTIINNYTVGLDSQAVVNIFNVEIQNYVEKINELTNVINTVRTLAANDSVRIDSLEGVTNGLNEDLTNLTNRVSDAEIRLLSDSIQIHVLDSLYANLKESLANYATIEYVDAADNKLNERIDSILDNVVPDLEQQISEAKTYAEELADSVGNLLTEAIQAVNDASTALPLTSATCRTLTTSMSRTTTSASANLRITLISWTRRSVKSTKLFRLLPPAWIISRTRWPSSSRASRSTAPRTPSSAKSILLLTHAATSSLHTTAQPPIRASSSPHTRLLTTPARRTSTASRMMPLCCRLSRTPSARVALRP